VTITRKRHAFEGRALAVISATRRRGVPYLLTILPDGSRSLIPASWTDWKAEPPAGTPTIDTDDAAHDLGRLGDLLRLLALVEALQLRRRVGAGQGGPPCN
jgi:hypothetical protein